MTTIIALKDEKIGIVIASDRQVSAGLRKNYMIDNTAKWLVSEDHVWAVASSGRFRTMNILRANADTVLHKLESPDDFVFRLQQVLAENNFAHRASDGESEPDRHLTMDCHFILTNGDQIWSISHDYSIFEVEKFVAEGSGAEFAMGALHALTMSKTKLKPVEVVMTALGASCSYDAASGGDPFVAIIGK